MVAGTKGSRLWCSGLMLDLGSLITSGKGREGVRMGVAAVGKFSGWRSWLMEELVDRGVGGVGIQCLHV